MESHHSIPPSDEVEMGDDIPRDIKPRSVSSLTSSSISAMSGTQNAAVAGNSGELERQRQLAQYERQQQEIIYNQQLELVRQNTEKMLQEQKQSHREEATIATGYVIQLTETALNKLNNKLNKQTQEQQHMAANDERTKQRITARRNQ